MIKDSKVPVIYGLLGVFQDDAGFLSFDGKNWNFRDKDLYNHLKQIADAKADGVRIFSGPVWGHHKYGKRSQFQPYLLDEKADLWNLDYWNTYFFPILTKTIQMINDLNMTAILPWFENCQFHGIYRRWSCWANNVQRLGSFYEPKADKRSTKWMFTTWNRYYKKYDIMFPFGNEDENAGFPDMAKRVILPFVKKYALDFSRLTYGATTTVSSGDSIQDQVRLLVREAFGPKAEKDMMMEDHGYPFAASLPVWGKKPWRKIYSDDGFYGGKSLCDRRDKGARPSAVEWGAKAKYILDHYPASVSGRPRLISFEHLPGVYPPDTACQAATIRAIKKACEGA